MRLESHRASSLELRGERITLRPPRSGDARAFGLLRKKSAPVYRGLMVPFTGKDLFAEYLQRCRRDDFFGFLICRNFDGVILGNINLFHVVLQRLRSACVGYFVGAPFSRNGYASEALQLVLRFAFQQVKLNRVEANIQPQNAPSLAMVKRAGFTREGYSRRYLKIAGRWRDHERWAMLAEDWADAWYEENRSESFSLYSVALPRQ